MSSIKTAKDFWRHASGLYLTKHVEYGEEFDSTDHWEPFEYHSTEDVEVYISTLARSMAEIHNKAIGDRLSNSL